MHNRNSSDVQYRAVASVAGPFPYHIAKGLEQRRKKQERGPCCTGVADQPSNCRTVKRALETDLQRLIHVIAYLQNEDIRPHYRDIERHLSYRHVSERFSNGGFLEVVRAHPNIFEVEQPDEKHMYIFLKAKPRNRDEPQPKKEDTNDVKHVTRALWELMVNVLSKSYANEMTQSIAPIDLGDWAIRRPQRMAFLFNGGRCGMAQWLRATDLPPYRDVALGDLSQIIQSFITLGVLKYSNDLLQPVAACKGTADAFRHEARPLRDMDLNTLPQKNPDNAQHACEILVRILRNKKEPVLLAKLRRCFAEEGYTFAATQHGFTKISDLLKSELFPFHKCANVKQTKDKKRVIVLLDAPTNEVPKSTAGPIVAQTKCPMLAESRRGGCGAPNLMERDIRDALKEVFLTNSESVECDKNILLHEYSTADPPWIAQNEMGIFNFNLLSIPNFN
eukprot:Selendium_serpulae@DN5737_c0_g1_i11.p2